MDARQCVILRKGEHRVIGSSLSGTKQSDLFAMFKRIVNLKPNFSPCRKYENVSFSHSQLPLPSRDEARDEYNGEVSDWQCWSIEPA
jgi:hypothetical protein